MLVLESYPYISNHTVLIRCTQLLLGNINGLSLIFSAYLRKLRKHNVAGRIARVSRRW